MYSGTLNGYAYSIRKKKIYKNYKRIYDRMSWEKIKMKKWTNEYENKGKNDWKGQYIKMGIEEKNEMLADSGDETCYIILSGGWMSYRFS